MIDLIKLAAIVVLGMTIFTTTLDNPEICSNPPGGGGELPPPVPGQ